MKRNPLLVLALVFSSAPVSASPGVDESLGNLFGRERTSLSGEWHYVVDPLQMGLSNDGSSRYLLARERGQEPGGPLLEFYWDQQRIMKVPSDWSSAVTELELYQGMVWF